MSISKLTKKVNRKSSAMSAGTLLSRLLGFARDVVIGYFFTRTETDAFFVAFRFPNFFRRFFGEGALTVSFIPVFTECLYGSKGVKKDFEKAKNLMNSIYTLLLIVTSTLTVLGIVMMDSMIDWMFGSYSFAQIEGKIEMTTYLARFLFIYLFLVVTYAYYTAVANALKKFFIPSLAPGILNVAVILFVLILPKEMFRYPSMVLVAGVLTGGVLQTLIVAAILIKLKFLPKPVFSTTFHHWKIVLVKFLPAIAGVGGFALIGMLNVFFAGWLKEGAHTYIYYADRLLELPRSLVAVSIGTALLPTLSKLSVLKRNDSFLDLAAHQRDILIYIILPCCFALYFLGDSIVSALFGYGKFDQVAITNTGEVLKIYSPLLIVLSLNQVLSTCFFSIKNTWYPAICTLVGLLAHAAITPFMIHLWDLSGLVGATLASSVVQLVFLAAAYPKMIGQTYWIRTFLRVLPNIVPLIIYSLYIYFSFDRILSFLTPYMSSTMAQLVTLMWVSFSSIILYGLIGLIFGVIPAQECFYFLKRKVRFFNNERADI